MNTIHEEIANVDEMLTQANHLINTAYMLQAHARIIHRDAHLNYDEAATYREVWCDHMDTHHPDGSRCHHGPKT